MTISCDIWMICLELNWFWYDPSRMLQLSEFVKKLRSSVWYVFNNFLITDATDRRKIRSDQKRLFIAVSLYPLSFSRTLPLTILISILCFYKEYFEKKIGSSCVRYLPEIERSLAGNPVRHLTKLSFLVSRGHRIWYYRGRGGHPNWVYFINLLFVSNKAWTLKNFFWEKSLSCLNVMFKLRILTKNPLFNWKLWK